jgi:prepilin-type N-terminal cleavage/methylation domain-containing protein
MMNATYPHNNTPKKSGFSLVELMIVIVVTSILAAIAIPIYSNNVEKAKRAEADAALGSILKELEVFRAEYDRYPKERNDEYVIGSGWNDIKPGELTGKYFSDSSYTYWGSPNGKFFKITCAKGEVLQFNRTLDHDRIFLDE